MPSSSSQKCPVQYFDNQLNLFKEDLTLNLFGTCHFDYSHLLNMFTLFPLMIKLCKWRDFPLNQIVAIQQSKTQVMPTTPL